MKKLFTVIVLFSLVISPSFLSAQEEKVLEEVQGEREDGAPEIIFGADLMSRYIWRGIDYGNSPAIQPNLAFAWKGLNIGAWGSYAFAKHSIELNDSTVVDAGNYSEADLYISYTWKWFTLMVYDYFTVNGLNPNEGNNYFDYRNATTGHTFEGCLTFEGPEKFPVQIMASTLFYGADKDQDSTGIYGLGNHNNFSTYFELSYNFNLERMKVQLRPFIGGIPFGSSWYGPYAGVTNIGLTARKDLPITPIYSLPLQVSLVTNPQAQSIFFVFGISF